MGLKTMNEYREQVESIEPHVTIKVGDNLSPIDEWNNEAVFTYGDSGLTSDIHHRFGDYEASFDLTDFRSARVFAGVLDNLNLHPVEEYFRLSLGSNESNDRYVYVWANSEGMIITGNNPITGAYSRPEDRHNQVGYASYIGIEGTPSFVEKATELIKKNGNWKDYDTESRSFM
jgi:hypothetical protein